MPPARRMSGACSPICAHGFRKAPLAIAVACCLFASPVARAALEAAVPALEEQDDALFDSGIQTAPSGVSPESSAGAAETRVGAPPVTPTAGLSSPERADAVSAEQAARDRETPSAWFGYERAPIRWSGRLGLDYLTTGESSSFLESLNLSGSSFVVAPYVAELSGNLYVTKAQVRADQSSSSGSLAGSGVLSLFNRSRWPLRISVDSGEASTTLGGTTTSTTSRSIALDQSYRPQDASYVVSGQLGRAAYETNTGDETIAGNRSLSYTPTLRTEMPQTLSVSTAYSGFDRHTGSGNVRFSTTQLNANHSINMEEWNGFRFDNAINANRLADSATGTGLRANDFVQLTSGFSWLPEDPDSLLTVSGGIGVNRFRASATGVDATSDTYVGNVSVNIPLSPRLSTNYGVQLFHSVSEQVTNSGQSLSASLFYQGEPRQLWDFDYSWGLGAGAGVSGTTTGDSAFLNSNAQQSLSRAKELDEGKGSARLTFTQSLAVSEFRGLVEGRSSTVSHAAAFSWSRVVADALPMNGNVSVDDRRSSGLNASWSQSVRSSINASRVVSWRETLSAIGTLDFVRQGSDQTAGADERGWIGSGFLAATYQNTRTWNLPRLTSKVEYRMTAVPASATGTLVVEHALLPEMNYRIGLLRLRLNGALREQEGVVTHSLQLSIVRDFGGTL